MKISAISALVNCQKYVWTGIFIAIFLTACGYRFSGSGSLPGGIQTVAVQVLKNRTTETGLENILTNDLIFEFIQRGKTIQKNVKKAEAVLSGTIDSSQITTISRAGLQSPLTRQIQITVSLKLTGSDDRVLWSVSGMSDYEAYNVAADKQATDINKQNALITLSKRLSQKIYSRLTDNF
jgi:outer membrane lipopolysaccharide assembly protein LptE/RlpB